MKKLINILINTKTTAVLLLLFIFMMARATFIENDFGTQTAKAEIYNSFLFEIVMLLLAINFIGNITRYKLMQKSKTGLFLFHTAFIIIMLGAFVTRYFGYEGVMHIRQNETSNSIVSYDNYISILVNNGEVQKSYEKKIIMSSVSKNSFSKEIEFKEKDLNFELIKYIPNATKKIITDKEKGEKIFSLVILPPNGQKQDVTLKENQVINLSSDLAISFNKNEIKDINIYFDNGNPYIQAKEDMEMLNMVTMESSTIEANKVNIFKKKIYQYRNFKIVLKEYFLNGRVDYVSQKEKTNDILIFKSNNETFEVSGKNGVVGNYNWKEIEGLYVGISYGAKSIEIPFSIKLDKFNLEKYAGSNSPKSYESEITLTDEGKQEKHKIYMNNTLKHKGYKFFQSSYDSDGKGTVLSVNYDTLGTWITYIGYFLMTLGMGITLFSKTRFGKLLKKLSKNKVPILLLFGALFLTNEISAKEIDKKHSENFGKLLIQDTRGRIKPINTMALDVIRKVYGKDSYNGLDANQFLLSIISDPEKWQKEPIIKIKNKDVIKLISPNKTYFSFLDFFDEEYNYKLIDKVNKIYSKQEKDRDEFDKGILKTDEKLNILFSIYNRSFLNIYPLEGDKNNAWYTSKGAKFFPKVDSLFVSSIEKMYISEVNTILEENNKSWASSDSLINYINMYQYKKSSKEILPTESRVKAEIYYNKSNIFLKLYKYYTFLGLISLVIFFLMIFNDKKIYSKIFSVLKITLGILFLYHTLGLVIRWYISGHAPWSNGYESMIYISWGMALGGIIFSNKSKILIPASSLVAGITLFVAKLNMFDPQITSLVPVLDSYWLIIHVAVIMISYSFFGIVTIIALMVNILMIIRNKNNKEKYNSIIEEFLTINEIGMTVGLFLLSVGTFLGGVWANESWGRYWGWDPKETWALISMVFYAAVLHLRLIPSMRSGFIFNLFTIIGFGFILMTYFGVNYYLSGLHSYAKGDPVPIPNFVYYSIAVIFILSLVSYFRDKKIK